MTTSPGSAAREPLPPTPDCEPGLYCPFTDNGAYHGVCLWHEGPERTCTCDGRTAHSGGPPAPSAAASLRASVLWVIFTAVTWASVLVAATAPRWDTTLSACAICFARGGWRRGG